MYPIKSIILAVALGVACRPAVASAQAPQEGGASEATGRIVGHVLSEDTGDPLRSAQVYIPGPDLGGLTSLDGRYVIRTVPAGTYDLRVESLGYGSKTVTGIVVAAGQTTVLDIQLASEAIQVEGVTVTATAERGSTTSLLTERRSSTVVSDAIGSDQMSRSPDGDAAAALQRVPGLTVVDNQFALVRGLGERYSSTTLNGSPLASPVPDKKVIPLDMFPSGLLESIVTSKSFSPENPGDYAGGLVELRTRAFPANRVFSLSAGTSWSSESTFATGLGYDPGDNLDILGLSKGSRDLPDLVPADRRVSSANLSQLELEQIGEAFVQGSDFGPVAEELPVNSSFSLTYGDDFDFDDDVRFGFITSANYSSDYGYRANQIERVFTGDNAQDPDVDYAGDISNHSVQWGGLLGATFQPAGHSQLRLSTLYNRRAEDMARVFEGFNLDKNTNQRNTRIQYIQTQMLNAQLEGEHTIEDLGDLTIDWRGAYTRADRYEPSTREALYQQVGETYYFDDFVQSGSVFHQDQTDDGISGAVDLELPFELGERNSSVGIGASTDRKDRSTFTRRFRFRPDRSSNTILTSEVLALSPNELLVPEHIGPNGFRLEESTFRTDNYDAAENIDAAYLTLNLGLLDDWRLSGGVRVERSRQTVTPFDLFDLGLPPEGEADLDQTDILPAVNVTWEFADDMNFRGSASQTLARPQLRELAPFGFADYAGGYLVLGNPTLDRSLIQNYDLRWEWFPQANAVVAVSGFYKNFDNPIEVLVLPSTEAIRSWVNVSEATNYGAEIELRSDLAFVSDALEEFTFNGNVTLVESDVAVQGELSTYVPGQGSQDIFIPDRSRPLEGQSPYVVNIGLSWFDVTTGASASLLFNRYGERINAVGGGSTPDIMEEARSTLDFVVSKPFGNLDLKLSASRLVGSEVTFTQGGALLREYDTGRSVSLGLSWNPLD